MGMQIPIEIKGYPLPPSANNLYANNARTGGRFKTEKYKSYELEVARWARLNAYQLDPLRRIIEKMKPNWVFHVDRQFYQKPYRIMTKLGAPRKNDTSNRFKALDDTMSQLLGIDDSYFWCGSFDKHPALHPALGEYVDLKFTVMCLDPLPEDESA